MNSFQTAIFYLRYVEKVFIDSKADFPSWHFLASSCTIYISGHDIFKQQITTLWLFTYSEEVLRKIKMRKIVNDETSIW